MVNVDKLNSVRNSCVFAVFEAPDCSSNLHIALNRYHDQIDHLQNSCWMYVIKLIIIIINVLSRLHYQSIYVRGLQILVPHVWVIGSQWYVHIHMYMHIINKFHLSKIRSSLLLMVFYITGPIKYSTCSTIQ